MTRKRANTSKRATAAKEKAVPIIDPLQQRETMYFQELVELSNLYAKLRKQYEQYEFIVKKLEDKRTAIQKGDIKLPILVQLSANSYYSEYDKKAVLEDLDKQIDALHKSMIGVKGQLDHRRDDFVESGLRLMEYATKRFQGYKHKNINADRRTAKKEEEQIFEAEFDKLFGKDADPKVQEEFKKAKAEAVAKNKEQVKK